MTAIGCDLETILSRCPCSYLAGLQTLPRDISDAASVDGAGIFQRFRHITLPWLRPALTVVTVLNVIYGLMQFDVIFAMTQGGPGSSTTLLELPYLSSILHLHQLWSWLRSGCGARPYRT